MSENPESRKEGLEKGASEEDERPRSKSQRELHKEDPEKYSDDDDDEPEKVVAGAAAGGGASDEHLLREMLRMKITEGKQEERDKPKVLDEVSFQGIVNYIKSGKATNIITMAGAGISTSAGIPDFRSPGSGLYHNLEKYNLPSPEAIFSIEFFKRNPEPFFQLARELYPDNFEPTPSHHFVRLLEQRGLLLRHYTQNIDTLERVAGISGEKLVEAHGTFHSAHCIGASCAKEYTQEWVKEKIFGDITPTCERCNSIVKPDIIFFGEALPKRFFTLVAQDFVKCDLLIILGTSLTVQPFASLIDRVPSTCPRLLINMTKAGNDGSDFLLRLLGKGGLDFDSDDNYRDVAKLGACDEGCIELANALGWKDDLDALINQRTKNKSRATKKTDAAAKI